MGRWCEEESVKWRWRAADRDERAGRFGSEFPSLDSAVSAYSWLTLFLPLSLSFLFVYLFVCLFSLCSLGWSAWSFYIVPKGMVVRKPKRILHCLSATLICCFSLAIYAFYCFGKLDLSSSHFSSFSIAHYSPSHSLSFALSFSLSRLAATVLFIVVARNKGQEGESERRIETMQIHREKKEDV